MAPSQHEDVDSLASLEDRIRRTVELVASLRKEKEAAVEAAIAERDAARREAADAETRIRKLSQELEDLRSERKQVRTRIEKLLGQMDLLSGV
jgi:FtsZ-binding cell division protein ZapB